MQIIISVLASKVINLTIYKNCQPELALLCRSGYAEASRTRIVIINPPSTSR